MSDIKASQINQLAKRWALVISIFIIVQLIFILIDGTFLEPNINDSNHFIHRTARQLLDSKLFTEWIAPYSFPFFNLTMTIHVIALFIQVLKDLTSNIAYKK